MGDPTPDSAPISLTAYAKRRGVSAMAVSRAVRAGRLVKSVTRDAAGQPKIADPELADREWAENTDLTKAPAYVKDRARVAAGGEPGDGEALEDLSVATAAARLKKWQADLAELKFKEAARELVPARDVEARLVDVFSAARVKLLALPSRAKQALPHLTAADLEVLEAIVREALEDLAA